MATVAIFATSRFHAPTTAQAMGKRMAQSPPTIVGVCVRRDSPTLSARPRFRAPWIAMAMVSRVAPFPKTIALVFAVLDTAVTGVKPRSLAI